MPRIAISLAIAALALSESPGSALTTGMELVYSVADTENPVQVMSAADTTIGGIAACRVIVLRRAGESDERRTWCASGDMLLAWDTASHALRPIRPIGEGMSLDVPIGRERSSYSSRSALEQTVSGVRYRVLETVVITRDSTGRQVQRVREFFAPALATATSGVIEVPDSARAGSWRIQTAYKLVRIMP